MSRIQQTIINGQRKLLNKAVKIYHYERKQKEKYKDKIKELKHKLKFMKSFIKYNKEKLCPTKKQ